MALKPYYEDEHGVLYLGDCLEIMKEMPDKSVDLVLTDIPYGEVNRTDNGLRNLHKGNADIVTCHLEAIVDLLIRISRGSVYCFCGTEQVSLIRAMLVNAGMSSRLCIWEKTNPSPMNGEHLWLSAIECCVFGKWGGGVFNEKCKSPVWRYPTERKRLHPTQKPMRLFKYLIETSAKRDGVIWDGFLGSGTTAVAAKEMGCKYIGIDICEKYLEIAANRLRQKVMF